MTIRIRFLKHWNQPYQEGSYRPGDMAFMARATAEILCRHGIAETVDGDASGAGR